MAHDNENMSEDLIDNVREKAQNLLKEYIENENLRWHCEMVAMAMEAYARELGKTGEEIEKWWIAGLLHDLDWEKYPDEHPNMAISKILPQAGFEDQEILDAIAAHAPSRTGKSPESEMERYLFACDELSGFINAVALMRPDKFAGMKPKSVKKKLKDKKFAAGVSRDDIKQGAELIERDLDEHIQFLINLFTGNN